MADVERVREQLQITNLQVRDPHVVQIIARAKYAGLYHMHEDPSTGVTNWAKGQVEGELVVLERKAAPRYQVLIKNQLGHDDLIEAPTLEWELDVHPNYLLYKVADGTIKGWWFHDDDERKYIQSVVERCIQDLQRRGHPAPPPPPAQPAGDAGEEIMNMLMRQQEPRQPERDRPREPLPAYDPAVAAKGKGKGVHAQPQPPAPPQPPPPPSYEPTVTVTREQLKATLVEMVSSDQFLDRMMARLQPPARTYT